MDHAINSLSPFLEYEWNELVKEWKSRDYLKLSDCPSYGSAKSIVDAIHVMERYYYGEPKCITLKNHVEWTLGEDLIDGVRKARAWLQEETKKLNGAKIAQYYDWAVIRWAKDNGQIPEDLELTAIRSMIEVKPPELTSDGYGHTFFFISPERTTSWDVTIPNVTLRREVSVKFEG